MCNFIEIPWNPLHVHPGCRVPEYEVKKMIKQFLVANSIFAEGIMFVIVEFVPKGEVVFLKTLKQAIPGAQYEC